MSGRRYTRILHFSDPHVPAPLSDVPFHDWLGKRVVGALNFVLRRRKYFERAEEKLSALAAFAKAHDIDAIICTGDYTTLGTESELQAAHRALQPLTEMNVPFITVPGNHDLYEQDCITESRFERYFGNAMYTDFPDLSVDGVWPLVRLIGNDIGVIGVNSSRPNREPWKSTGRIPNAQIKQLKKIARDARLQNRFVFIITHYAPLRRDGTPDTTLHGLENSTEFLDAVMAFQHGAVMHGHIHWRYSLVHPQGGPPLFCAGSVTHEHREGLWIFDVNGNSSVDVIPGGWDGQGYGLIQTQTVHIHE